MVTETASSDMSVGLSVLFGAVGLLGALGMYLFATGGDQVATGVSFAVAMLAAGVLVAVIHAYA